MSEEFKNNLPNNDDYVIGKGFEVEAIEINETPKKRKKKAKNGLKATISIILIVVISIGLGYYLCGRRLFRRWLWQRRGCSD